MRNSQEQVKDLLRLLKEKATQEEHVKKLNELIYLQSQNLYDQMGEENIDKISLEGVEFKPAIDQNFTLAEGVDVKRWDNLPDWFGWLKEIGEEGLIKKIETVNAQTRKKFLKEWVGENKPLPDFIKETFANIIKYNKNDVKRIVNTEMINGGQ